MVGCATKTSYIPPDQYDVTNKVTVNKPFNTVWKKLLVSLSGDFFVINNIEKDSGIINVSFSSNTPSEYIDCGMTTRSIESFSKNSTTYQSADSAEYKIFSYPHWINVKRKTTLNGRANILLQDAGKSKTDVTVNAKYVMDVKLEGYLNNGRFIGSENFSTDGFTSRTSAVMNVGEGQWECRSRGKLEKMIIDYIQ